MSSMEQAVKAFLAEAKELLEDMEDSLLQLENNPEDEDAINAIFRAAHTIKGTAGIFGFDHVESFTHVVENLLDEIRDGKIQISEDLIAVLLKSRDQIGVLVELAVDDDEVDAETLSDNASLLSQLRGILGVVDDDKPESQPQESPPSTVESHDSKAISPEEWVINLHFSKDVLKGGMDPLSFFRYLTKLGEIKSIDINHSSICDLHSMDPEECHLSYSIKFLVIGVTKREIEAVFDFVKEDVEISILPPVSHVWEYITSIEGLPDDIHSLGEMLKQSGTLTHDELVNALEKQQQLRSKGDEPEENTRLGKILVDERVVREEVVEAALSKQQKVKDKKITSARQLRVDADKLDGLINLVGELVIAGATTNLLGEKSGDSDLMESISSMSRLVEEIRDSALRLRMVQIGETFNRFQRVVRDVSRELGKDIQLLLSGGDTELDKTMVEKIGDPLMHLVRNAMDHGIEASDDRIANGKSGQGSLTLNAYHDSGSIVIQVIDDGKGLDKDVILAKAIEKGIVEPGIALSDKEIYRLIFEPGFSTAAAVTNLSGRGVGMDVVKRNIESLRGTVEVDSEKGKGTTINIRLPLTLAIIDGFLVEISGSSYVIPLDMVVECIELNEENEALSVHNNYINLRGKVLPYLRLRDVFGGNGPSSGRENIVVVQNAGQTAGLVVDELHGEFQTVIKPLGKIFQHLKGVSGSTILGSGEVAIILDVPGLMHKAITQSNVHGHMNFEPPLGGDSTHPTIH